MAYMTGPEMLAYVKRDLKRTDKDTEIYEAITDSVWFLRLVFSWEEFKEITYTASGDVVAGDHKFTLPDDFGHLLDDIKILDGDQSYVLEKKSKDEYDQLEPHPNYSDVDTAKPTIYCVYGGEVYIWPVSDDSYQFEFNYTTESKAEIDADTLEVPFTDRYRELLKSETIYRTYRGLENDEQAAKWKAIAKELRDFAADNDEQNIDSPEFIAENKYGE